MVVNINSVLKKLSSVKPGAVYDLAVEIRDLERSLGMRPTLTLNPQRAKLRLEQLQAIAAEKRQPAVPVPDAAPEVPAVPAPVVIPPSGEVAAVPALSGVARTAAAFRQSAAAETRKLATVAAAAPAVATGLMSTAKLSALCAAVFGRPVTFDGDPQTRARCLARLREVGVEVPGVEPSPHNPELTGIARMNRAAYLVKVNQFLSINN